MTSPDDRAALDAEYNLRAAVPTFQAYFDRYDEMSAAFRGRRPGRPDLAYGPGARQRIDLFLPDAPAAPLLAFIHGGYWHSQDRKRFGFVAEPLVARGAAVALIGYDLAPDVDMDAIAAEIKDAITWLHRHASTHGIDGGRLFLAGHSAGGHLAALALATDWPRERGLPANVIKGVCAVSGVFDLEPIRHCYLNDVLSMSAEQARRNSPIHMAPRTHCPVMVAVGEKETPAFLEQSRNYAAMLEANGLPVELAIVSGLDHFGVVEAMAAAESPMVGWLTREMRLSGADGA